MKKNDFISNMKKNIENRQNRIATITNEMASVKATVDELTAKINEFADINDVRTFGKLKEDRSINENRYELLERKLNAEKHALDMNLSQTIRAFQMEFEEIDRRCEADVIPSVITMQKRCEDASEEKTELQNMFNKWVEVYNVPANLLSGASTFGMMDVTGTTVAVTKLYNTFKQAGKI